MQPTTTIQRMAGRAWRRVTGIVVAGALALLACAALPSAAEAQQSLTVALYPYVPRLAQFQSAIIAAWARVQPGVQLNFINDQGVWDGGYHTDPPAQADVYVFDAMYFEDFRNRGFLVSMAPSEIQNAADFLSYARDAVMVGGNYFAIPHLGCSNILFFQASDSALAQATTLGQLQTTLGQCSYTSEIPPDRRGLMFPMSGSTTNATLYLDIAHSNNGIYPLPQPTTPVPAYITNQYLMLTMGSWWDAMSQDSTPYVNAVWFNRGYGRAYMGFTESMSVMNPATLANIGFKVMPLSNNAATPPLFYVDAIGVNTTTGSRGTRALAVQLANVIAASDTVVASFEAQGGAGNPQYLMSVRNSVFQNLGQRYPIYQRMYAMVQAAKPQAFKLDANGRNWVSKTGKVIQQQVSAGYACGCDQTSSQPIADDNAARRICPAVCSGHGGWNGQWTNQPPAPGSVCGCRTCPIH